MMLFGAGFIVSRDEAAKLHLGKVPELERNIREYRNGRDLTDTPRDLLVIDLFGLSAEEVRQRFPAMYQWVLERVKPERDQNRDKSIRENWWLHGRPRPELRLALTGLSRYIATVETAKHRTFQFLDKSVLPDNKLIAIALDSPIALGVLSSHAHVTWALAGGSWLGVGNDPVYVKSRCFETFPFPALTPAQQTRIRDLAEQLDAHRKRQQVAHPGLTLTGMYNVLEKLKSGEPLTEKEKTIHEHGLVSVLKQLHDEIDLAVLEAYGWSDLAPLMRTVNGNAAPATDSTPATREEAKRLLDEALLNRLVALNAERVAEEARGLVRWLRPELQNPVKPAAPALRTQVEIEMPEEEHIAAVPGVPAAKRTWPRELPEQVRQVAEVLAGARAPLADAAIAERFSGRGRWRERLPQIVETLVSVGRARRVPEGVIGLN